ncbi:MAG: flavin monoamine oxidase family protein, partial [Planctomycetia bacterium]
MPSSRQAPLDRRPRVAIVGGGPGGLFTAWQLERLAATPPDLTIFEAAPRLGGKVWSPEFATAPMPYEAGAAELYDYSPVDSDPLRQLVWSLGLPTVPLSGTAIHLDPSLPDPSRQGEAEEPSRSMARKAWIANLDDIGDVLGSAARREVTDFDLRARSAMSPREVYESGAASAAPPDASRCADVVAVLSCPRARRYVESFIHSDLAAEPHSTTACYGLQNYLMNDPAYMRLYRIVGGNERLIRAVADRLAATIRLNTTVTGVNAGSSARLAVTWVTDGSPQCTEFDAVVLALPIAPLAAITFDDPPLAEAVREHVAQHDHPAHYLRITMLVDHPITGVPGGDDYLMLDAFGGACLYVETARDPAASFSVLGWLLGGAAAARMASLPDDSLVAAALDSQPASLAHLPG